MWPLFQESQPLTGSSDSSKRTSIRSHSVIPEINILTEQLENSLKEISSEENQQQNLQDSTENLNKHATSIPKIGVTQDEEQQFEGVTSF